MKNRFLFYKYNAPLERDRLVGESFATNITLLRSEKTLCESLLKLCDLCGKFIFKIQKELKPKTQNLKP